MGYFRVQSEGDISLNPEDIALAKAVFTNPDQVFLIISGAGAANASFFFWDGGQIYGDFAFLEFPFDASQLPAHKTTRLEPPPVTATTPVPEPTSHNLGAGSFGTDSKRPSPEGASHAPNGRSSSASLKMPTRDGASHPPDTGFSGPSSNAPDLRPESHRSNEEFSGPGSKAKYGAVLAAICVGACVGLIAGLRSLPSSAATSPAPVPISSSASLGLEVERTDFGDLKITWNNRNPLMLKAAGGTLVVEDGPGKRRISLNQRVIRSGSMRYSPKSTKVQMSLEIQGPSGMVTETALVWMSKEPAPAR
jgi:hypothetical protein